MGDMQQQHVSGNDANRAPIYGGLLSMKRKTPFFYCAGLRHTKTYVGALSVFPLYR